MRKIMLRPSRRLFRWLLLLFVLNDVNCAPVTVAHFPNSATAPFTSKPYVGVFQPRINDLQSASNVVQFNNQDPRNQAIGSSYAILETSGGSSGGINRLTYSKKEYEPHSSNSEYRRIKSNFDENNSASKEFPAKSSSFVSFDNSASQEFPSKSVFGDNSGNLREFPYSSDDSDKFFLEERRSKKPEPKSRPREGKRKAKPTKRPVSEDAEKVPLRSAGSTKSSKIKEDVGDLSQPSRHFHHRLGGDEDSYEEGYDKEKHYDKEGGKKFIEAHKAESGEKAGKEYKTEEGFDKAEQEKHGKEEKVAAVSEKESAKKGHLEEEKHHGEEYKGQEGEKGISVKKKGGHKKGHKKNGFHKVHHRDEYKKDEVFYDDEHDQNEHEEHAHEHEKHAKEKGDAAKKTHLDSAYHEGHNEKKGVQDKGHHYEEASGHKKEAGQEHHHDEHSKYGKKGGVKEGEKHGHAEKGGSGGGYSEHGFGF